MNRHEAVLFLFTIAKEIKRSLESPVILVTQRDYADIIFNSLVDMRRCLLKDADPESVADIVNSFHLEWLQAVQDIENFKKRIKDIPRETIVAAIDFTMNCVKNRHKYFQKYIENVYTTMTGEEKNLMQTDLEIIEDMHETVNSVILEKRNCLLNLADQTEYLVKVEDEIEELLNWLDRLNDNLAIQFSKVINLRIPQLPSDLTKTLKQVIEDVTMSNDPNAQELAKDLKTKGVLIGSVVRVNAPHELEIAKVVEKIKILENRMEQLKHEKSSALMALQHKTLYLHDRLSSLENLKMSLNALKNQQMESEPDKDTLKNQELHIFNHILPAPDRFYLVEQLVKLWDRAICGTRNRKSIISILSAADLKEVFSDEIGQFTVDKYGRKLYAKSEDDNLYQLNEMNELVALKDDEKHVYFYDECGRYYLNETRQRIYKAHESASEYILHPSGVLLKLAEEKDGIVYGFDNLGRYFINNEGKKIYVDSETKAQYESDGLGNLVVVRSEDENYEPCPNEPMVLNECKYLKQTIGDALKKCLADVILHQPPDPIKYLANSLVTYRFNIEARQKRLDDEKEMLAERDLRNPKHKTKSRTSSADEEYSCSTIDENFTAYKSMIIDF